MDLSINSRPLTVLSPWFIKVKDERVGWDAILHPEILDLQLSHILINSKFEGYKLGLVSQEIARYTLPYGATQSTVSTSSPLSFEEVQSRITHNHISVAPHALRAVYVDTQYRVILVELNAETLFPSFRPVYELPQPLQSQDSSLHREYPSAAFLSASEIFVSDGGGYLYFLRDSGHSSFQLFGMYELPQSTPFRIHSITTRPADAVLLVLSYRHDDPSVIPNRQTKQHVEFHVCAVKFNVPVVECQSSAVQSLEIAWQRRGHAVPINVSYDNSRKVFMILGDSPYTQIEEPIVVPYNPSPAEMAPIPRANENLDAAPSEPPRPPPYSWTQTSDSLTVAFPLPSTTSKTNIKVVFSPQALSLHIQGNIAPDIPLPHYSSERLWDGISPSDSTWTWDREGERHFGLLTLHLEKQHEDTRWPHVFASSGTSAGDVEIQETLDPSELWHIRESLEKYTSALRSGDDASGVGLGSGVSSLAQGEADDEVDDSVGRSAQLTWVGEDGAVPSWSSSSDLPSRLLSTELPGTGTGAGCSLVVKNGVDGTVFALEPAASAEQSPSWAHTYTFSALSFVLASKTDTRFTYHIPSKAVLAFENGLSGRSGNVYIYRAAPTQDIWAEQSILKVGEEGCLLGVGAFQTETQTVLVCLTEKQLVVLSNIPALERQEK